MKILITGASSYVGARIYSDLKKKYDVIGTYYSNKLFPELKLLDIRDKGQVKALVDSVKPDFIVHVAANPNARWCEANSDQAIAINEDGTKNIVDAANKANSKVIFISSFAIANQDSVYARTKIESEKIVKKVKAGYVILRPSLIVGFSPNTTNDRPFNRILKNITEKTLAVYDTSWKFQPTYLRHLDEVIEAIIKRGIINQTIPVSVPESTTRFDLANDILSEFKVKVTSEDKHDTQPVVLDDLAKLKELNLPRYSYAKMILEIKKEIGAYLKKAKSSDK
jgi:dTDP-4-dehydrorhamnose reductase